MFHFIRFIVFFTLGMIMVHMLVDRINNYRSTIPIIKKLSTYYFNTWIGRYTAYLFVRTILFIESFRKQNRYTQNNSIVYL